MQGAMSQGSDPTCVHLVFPLTALPLCLHRDTVHAVSCIVSFGEFCIDSSTPCLSLLLVLPLYCLLVFLLVIFKCYTHVQVRIYERRHSPMSFLSPWCQRVRWEGQLLPSTRFYLFPAARVNISEVHVRLCSTITYFND